MEVSFPTHNLFTEQALTKHKVDSLIAVEIRNWILKELKSEISILDILSPLPIQGLAVKIAEGSKILPAKLRVEATEKKTDEQETGANDEDEKAAEADAAATNADVPVKAEVVTTNVLELAMRPASETEPLEVTEAKVVETSVEVVKSETDAIATTISVTALS